MQYYYITFWREHILRGKYSVVFQNMTQISPNVCRLSKYDEVMKQEEVAELRKSKNDNEDLGETIKYLQVLFCLTPV